MSAPPWEPHPIPAKRTPADRAYAELPELERVTIRRGILDAGIHPRHHTYLARLVLAELDAKDGDRDLKRPRPPRELATGPAAKIALTRIADLVDRIRTDRASSREEAHRERGRPRERAGWDPAA